jgi:hypothetical protein
VNETSCCVKASSCTPVSILVVVEGKERKGESSSTSGRLNGERQLSCSTQLLRMIDCKDESRTSKSNNDLGHLIEVEVRQSVVLIGVHPVVYRQLLLDLSRPPSPFPARSSTFPAHSPAHSPAQLPSSSASSG